MSKRNDVLALLHVAGQSGATCNITADLLAELARAWLALDAAPVFDMHLVHDDSGRCIAANFATRSDPGQRVRLVAASGGESDG